MKKKTLFIPIYSIRLIFIEVESVKDSDLVEKEMKSIKCSKDLISLVKGNIERDCFDGGETIRNFDSNKIMVILYRSSSEKKRRNILNHEKRHVEDRILEYFNVSCIESSALLAGFLSENIY